MSSAPFGLVLGRGGSILLRQASMRRLFFLGPVLVLLLAVPAFAGEPDAAQIQAALSTGARGGDTSALWSFYERRAFAPVWSKDDATFLAAMFAHAGRDGLNSADYAVEANIPVAEQDVFLTNSLLNYLQDLRNGHPAAKTLDPDVELPSRDFDIPAALETALHDHTLPDFIRAQSPSQEGYAALKRALGFYADLADRGGWPVLAAGHIDDFSEGKPGGILLRRRLGYEDKIVAANPAAGLSEAVIRFQIRHGLVPDGRVGVRTLGELNVSASQRVLQIKANMERWRWLPRKLEQDFIAINVPEARLGLTLNGQEVMDSRVLVGRPSDPTPILRAIALGVTVNPVWNVPVSIARKELLPKLKANPSYLLSQDMVLLGGPSEDPHGLRIHWRAVPAGTFPFRVQQKAGPKNALGTIKIELPNRFDVYVHDTPGKRAFDLPRRDVSHGCVRVEQILPLASYALAASRDAEGDIRDAVSAGTTRYFPMSRRLPVYFLYWTAFADGNGNLQFRPDIYGRDRRLIAALKDGKAKRPGSENQ